VGIPVARSVEKTVKGTHARVKCIILVPVAMLWLELAIRQKARSSARSGPVPGYEAVDTTVSMNVVNPVMMATVIPASWSMRTK
jgi:hypothetical protein